MGPRVAPTRGPTPAAPCGRWASSTSASCRRSTGCRRRSAAARTIPPSRRPSATTEIGQGYAGGETRFQVFARVTDIRRHVGVTIKADVPDDERSAIDSWHAIYAGANWHERETHEMFGIGFDGHPDLRNMYLPDRVRGLPAAQGLPAARPHGEAVARHRRRRADARGGRRREGERRRRVARRRPRARRRRRPRPRRHGDADRRDGRDAPPTRRRRGRRRRGRRAPDTVVAEETAADVAPVAEEAAADVPASPRQLDGRRHRRGGRGGRRRGGRRAREATSGADAADACVTESTSGHFGRRRGPDASLQGS